MKWNDEAFESVKKVVEKRASVMTKTASFPQVGQFGSENTATASVELDFAAELDRAFSNRRY
jgi:hypothetical protein